MAPRVHVKGFEGALLALSVEEIDACIERFTTGASKPKSVYYDGKWAALQECRSQSDGSTFWILFSLGSASDIVATIGFPSDFPSLARKERGTDSARRAPLTRSSRPSRPRKKR